MEQRHIIRNGLTGGHCPFNNHSFENSVKFCKEWLQHFSQQGFFSQVSPQCKEGRRGRNYENSIVSPDIRQYSLDFSLCVFLRPRYTIFDIFSFSVAYQRMSWEALKKSINGLINKVRNMCILCMGDIIEMAVQDFLCYVSLFLHML